MCFVSGLQKVTRMERCRFCFASLQFHLLMPEIGSLYFAARQYLSGAHGMSKEFVKLTPAPMFHFVVAFLSPRYSAL